MSRTCLFYTQHKKIKEIERRILNVSRGDELERIRWWIDLVTPFCSGRGPVGRLLLRRNVTMPTRPHFLRARRKHFLRSSWCYTPTTLLRRYVRAYECMYVCTHVRTLGDFTLCSCTAVAQRFGATYYNFARFPTYRGPDARTSSL